MMKRIPVLFLLLSVQLSTAAQQNGNTMLWRISSKSGGSPSYLFGTIHLAQKRMMQFTDSVYHAIATTNTFYGELDYDNLLQSFGGGDAVAFFADKLKYIDSVSKTPAWKSMVQRMNKFYGTSVDPEKMDEVVTLGTKQMEVMYEPEDGLKAVDLMLSDYAKSLGKKTGGIETMQLQLNMMYSLIDSRLKDSTFSFGDEALLFESFKKYYENQQLDSVGAYLHAVNPQFRDIIFTRRNITMADSVAKYADAAPAFFAIGCGHLPGNDGVIALLRQKGYTVSPVHSANRMSLLLLNELKDKWQQLGRAAGAKEDALPDELTDDVKISDIKMEEVSDDVMRMPPPPPPPARKKAPARKPAVKKKK